MLQENKKFQLDYVWNKSNINILRTIGSVLRHTNINQSVETLLYALEYFRCNFQNTSSVIGDIVKLTKVDGGIGILKT